MAELQTSEKEQPVWKSFLDIGASLGFIVLLIMSVWSWITSGPNTMTYGIITAILGVYVTAKGTAQQEKQMDEFKTRLEVSPETLRGMDTYEVSYLGGHPAHTIPSSVTGTIGISPSKIGFIGKYFALGNFEIGLADITEVSEETQESLTVGRFLLVGVLAFALKKKEKYLRITFKNGIGEMSTMILQTPKANWIAQIINKKRYEYIASKKQ